MQRSTSKQRTITVEVHCRQCRAKTKVTVANHRTREALDSAVEKALVRRGWHVWPGGGCHCGCAMKGVAAA